MLFPVRYLRPLLVLLVVVCVPSVVSAINLNGSWTYRENGGNSVDTFRDFRQNYSFGVGPALTYQPSHALTANASVGYTQTDRVTEQGSRTARTITPTAGLSLVNDLFSSRFSGNTASTQSSGGDWFSSTNWNASLDSQWGEPYIPQLHFSYGEFGDESQSDAIASPKTQNKDFGAGVDWDLNLAEITYSYRQARSEDLPTNQSHFVKVETAARFWDNRIALSLSQQAQFDTQEVSGRAQGGLVEVAVGSTVRVAISPDDTPVGYTDNASSILGRDWLRSVSFTQTSPLSYSTSGTSEQVLIAINPSVTSRIRAVEISFAVDSFDDGDDSLWDLYEYRSSSDSWQLTEQDLPTTEVVVAGSTIRRQRIEFPETDQEFMLVSNVRTKQGGITNVDVLARASDKTNRRYLTNAGLQVRFSDTLSSSLNLTYDRDEEDSTEFGVASHLNTDRLTTSGSLSWSPFSFLTTSVGASEYRERKLGEEQQLNRNYTLLFSTAPLPTVNVSFGAHLNERFGVVLENDSVDIDQKTLKTLRYSVTGKAQIYPDLSASFNLSHSAGKRWLKDEDADTGRFVDSSGQSGRLDLNARLYKSLTADLITRYSQSEDDGIGAESGSAALGLRFRLSELLLVRGSYRTDFIGKDGPDSISLRMQVRLLDTDKARLEAAVGHTQAEEAVEVISFNSSWLVSKNMSLIGRGGYSFGESNSYNLTLDLRFGI